jgi:hypothetical protein
MTYLAGNQGGGWNPVTQTEFGTGGNALYFAAGYNAIAGVITAIRIRVASLSATKATVYVYQGVGPGATFISMSSEFDVSTAGDRIVPCLGTVAKGPVTFVIQAASGFFQTVANSGSGAFNDNQITAAHFPYRSPPPILPATDTNAGHEFLIWADGAPLQGTNFFIGPVNGLADNDPQSPPLLVQLSTGAVPTTRLVDPVNLLPVAVELSTAVVSTGAPVAAIPKIF